jgi:hypothetical protein
MAELFLREPARPLLLEPLTYSSIGSSAPAAPRSNQLGALAEALVVRAHNPVVWVGQTGFEDAIIELWSSLWPGLRRTFSFRLSFGPQDCADAPPLLVSTPASLESRWAGYRLVHPSRVQPARTEAAHLLLGLVEGQGLRDFIEGLGAQVDRLALADLPLFEECQRYVTKPDPMVDELLAAMRLLGRLSPSPGDGVAVKEIVIERLVRAVPTARGSAVLSMRNLDVNAFPFGKRVWDVVPLWTTEYAIPNAGSDADTAKVLAAAIPDASAAAPWKGAVWEGFDRAATNIDLPARADFAAAIWAWWTLAPALVGALVNRLPDDLSMEGQLADACPPGLDRAVADLMLDRTARRGWYQLHAAAAGAAYDLDEALDRQLAVDQDPASAAGLRALIRRAPREAIVGAALRRPDPRLMTIASQACS